ncbi:UPF0149 family protein [Niveispirillum fermenti]|uniref:UPF0149 family protein n=1 Tax=Niveispirillum fermenti TaxID=1233113 RepID=UPI003A8AEC8F
MANDFIDTALVELAGLSADPTQRHEALTAIGAALLRRPALGGQLVARFCAAPQDAPAMQDLGDLLDHALENARMAQEGGLKRGRDFLRAVDDAIILADGQGRLGSTHRLMLAGLWARNGLPAPDVLAINDTDEEMAELLSQASLGQDGDAIVGSLFDSLIEQADGDVGELHAALQESFPAMPPGMREHLVAYILTRPGAINLRLACFWLLDAAADLRLDAAEGLAARLARGELPGDIMPTLVILRSWMPEDAARAAVDRLLRDAMRAGIATPAATPATWTCHRIQATLPDGGGAQSIAVALQLGRERKMGMVLLKQGFGIKDAFVLPCTSASEQKRMTRQMAEDTGAQDIPPPVLARLLSQALADGLARNLPPAPGLIEVAALCGLTNLRPEPLETEAMIAALGPAATIPTLPAALRDQLVSASGQWWQRHPIAQSWFEENDEAHAALEGAKTARARNSALWKWLELRRVWWTRIIAQAAMVLDAAGHPDANSFTATALALQGGQKLKDIPVMSYIHEQTVQAWLHDGPDDGDIDEDPLTSANMDMSDPKPEREGELSRLLKGKGVSGDWIDGYLVGIVIAPKGVPPNRWIAPIMEKVVNVLDPASLQRFLDIILLRFNMSAELADDGTRMEKALSVRTGQAQREWAAGFTAAQASFKSAWSGKSLAPDDKAMGRTVSAAAQSGFQPGEVEILARWINARFVRSMG